MLASVTARWCRVDAEQRCGLNPTSKFKHNSMKNGKCFLSTQGFLIAEPETRSGGEIRIMSPINKADCHRQLLMVFPTKLCIFVDEVIRLNVETNMKMIKYFITF